MGTTAKAAQNVEPITTKEYEIQGTRFIVTATVRDGVSQDAASIVRRLIQRDIRSA